jgi:hypothetical protein
MAGQHYSSTPFGHSSKSFVLQQQLASQQQVAAEQASQIAGLQQQLQHLKP